MATKIPDGASIRVVVEVTDSTCAALESGPETSALAPAWAAMRDKADAQAKARLDCDRASARADQTRGVRRQEGCHCSGVRPGRRRCLGRAPRSTAVRALLRQDHAVGRAEIRHRARDWGSPGASSFLVRNQEAATWNVVARKSDHRCSEGGARETPLPILRSPRRSHPHTS